MKKRKAKLRLKYLSSLFKYVLATNSSIGGTINIDKANSKGDRSNILSFKKPSAPSAMEILSATR